MHRPAVDAVVEAGRRLPLQADGCGSFSRSSCFWALLVAPMWDIRFIGPVRDNLVFKKVPEGRKNEGKKSSFEMTLQIISV